MTDDSLRIHIVGAGLIGTSVGLASKRAGFRVSIEDSEPERMELATALIRGEGHLTQEPEIVIVAVPPGSSAKVIVDSLRRRTKSIVIDVASVKTKVLTEVKALSDDVHRYVPTHPIAGREVGGPANAQGDLFQGRPWVVTPHGTNSADSIETVGHLIRSIGGVVTMLTPEEHDQLFARISHLPQLLSTALSGQMLEVPGDVSLAGQGLRDMTRLAGSDGHLWSQIVVMNKTEISRSFDELKKIIARIDSALVDEDPSELLRIFQEGNEGRKLFAGKHGGKARDYVLFRIVIEDKPGVLADLFKLCGEHGVNVEDLQIEHTPNQETGLITIAVLPDQTNTLSSALSSHNWKFYIEEAGK